MEELLQCDWPHNFTEDQVLSYLSNATGLRLIRRLDEKLCLVYWRVVCLMCERKLPRLWNSVDQHHLSVDRYSFWFPPASFYQLPIIVILPEVILLYKEVHFWHILCIVKPLLTAKISFRFSEIYSKSFRVDLEHMFVFYLCNLFRPWFVVQL